MQKWTIPTNGESIKINKCQLQYDLFFLPYCSALFEAIISIRFLFCCSTKDQIVLLSPQETRLAPSQVEPWLVGLEHVWMGGGGYQRAYLAVPVHQVLHLAPQDLDVLRPQQEHPQPAHHLTPELELRTRPTEVRERHGGGPSTLLFPPSNKHLVNLRCFDGIAFVRSHI